ncbi:DUF459 domain-containing protein [Yinghuangia soli]|uniref:GDSL-type esterase/lipase family protein n=1 Tax=Yinghuangia soli TaxID=2908204 RepID=A0AA41Q062_9ACTN|nr:GDSL-type esterase/lipase family protein [Yinghuangia soli]MCF2527637.1 GDSL-type esterase/lipase family protein [Yinghuangia soli]
MNPDAPAWPDLRICFLGDSYTQGVGDREGRGWVGRLAEKAWDRGRPVTGYGLGVRRQTSSDILGRWSAEAAPRLAEGEAHGVVVAFGLNDTAHVDGRPRVPQDETVRNLETLLAEAAGRGWPVLVIGIPPMPAPRRPDGTAYATALEAAFAKTCAAHGVPFVPVYDRLVDRPEWWASIEAFGDGAHPDEAGYRMLADIVADGGWWPWLDAVAARA